MILAVKHNIEVAHRLFTSLPGNKCENIHGHSMKVTLNLDVEFDPEKCISRVDGEVLDFGSVKRDFRSYLDTNYDHRLLLNREDPFADTLVVIPEGYMDKIYPSDVVRIKLEEMQTLPGLQKITGDPTTENIARMIAEWAANQFTTDCVVEVWETDVNNARFGWSYTNEAELFTEPYPDIR